MEVRLGNRLLKMKEIIKKGPLFLYLFILFIPLYEKPLGVFLVALIIELFIRKTPLKKESFSTRFSLKKPAVWLLLFYFMHLVGVFYTSNMSFAIKDLGMKSTLLGFALVALFFSVKINWNWFLKVFIFGAFLSILVNVSFSSPHFFDGSGMKYFTNTNITHLMHRGYWSIYLIIAAFFLMKMGLEKSSSVKQRIAMTIGVFMLFGMVALTGSKMGLILIVFIMFWFFYQVFKQVQKLWILPTSVVVVLLLSWTVVKLVPSVEKRMGAMVAETAKPLEELNPEKPGSSGARRLTWDASISLIKENFWWGVGTGDVKDELIQRYKEKGYISPARKNLNSHNQFLNTHVAIGVFGVLFICMSFVTNCFRLPEDDYYSWRMGIIILLFFAMLTESMLEVKAGIAPYGFFLAMLTSITFFTKEKSEVKD